METKQAKLSVVLPIVKIRLEDLSYLRGLLDSETSGKPKCNVPRRNDARLRVLGLVEDVEVDPCPDEMRQYGVTIAQAKKTIQKAIKDDEWDWASLSGIPFWTIKNKPRPRILTKITSAGKKLLADGAANVVIKRSC